MTTALILIANHRFPIASLNRIIAKHRTHKLQPEIIVSYVGEPPTGIEADLVVNVPMGKMSLAAPRNKAALSTKAEWLMFADGDTYFTRELTELIELGHPVLRGDQRADTPNFNHNIGHYYTVVAAPMLVKRSLFEDVGGYHEGYLNYGHEDADFLHKFEDCPTTNAGAVHVMDIHHQLSGPDWERGRNANNELYKQRMAKPKEVRIAEDRATYFS